MYCKETATEFGSCKLLLVCNFSCLSFFPPLQVKHTDFCFTYHILPHQRKKTNNWFSVSEPWCSTITESRQPPVICLGPFTPVFKQTLDQIMKGILWHSFLFIAETQLSDPTSLFPLCDLTVHGDIKESLLPYSLTCLLCRQGKFYQHQTQ